jgi:hypothetical protein
MYKYGAVAVFLSLDPSPDHTSRTTQSCIDLKPTVVG